MPGTSCATASRPSASDRGESGSTASTSACPCARSWSPRRCSDCSSGIGVASPRPEAGGESPMSVAQSAAPEAPVGGESAKLHRRALGVPDLVFFIVAASAPLTAVAGGQAATYLVTGNRGVAFFFIPLGIVLGLFAVGYAAMSRHVANAGAFYAYVARGLGKVQGVGAAFVALIAYNAMQIGIYGLFGVAMGAFMADKLHITLDWYWWCLMAGAVIGSLGVLQIDLNARVLAVLLILEVLVVALFDIA